MQSIFGVLGQREIFSANNYIIIVVVWYGIYGEGEREPDFLAGEAAGDREPDRGDGDLSFLSLDPLLAELGDAERRGEREALNNKGHTNDLHIFQGIFFTFFWVNEILIFLYALLKVILIYVIWVILIWISILILI